MSPYQWYNRVKVQMVNSSFSAATSSGSDRRTRPNSPEGRTLACDIWQCETGRIGVVLLLSAGNLLFPVNLLLNNDFQSQFSSVYYSELHIAPFVTK